MMKHLYRIIFIFVVMTVMPSFLWAQAQPSDVQVYAKGQECYQKVKRDRKLRKNRSEWKRCITLFDTVAQRSNSSYAAKATYSSARLSRELHANVGGRGDLNSALIQYNKVVLDHPKSSLADDALYQIARIRVYQTKEPERARKALNTLLSRYPRGDTAPAARDMLASLDGRNESTRESKKETVELVEVSETVAYVAEVEEDATPTYSEKPASSKHPGVLIDVRHTREGKNTVVTLFFNRPVSYKSTYESGKRRSRSKPSVDVLLKETYARIGLPEKITVNSPTVKRVKVGPRILGGTRVRFDLKKNTDYGIRGNKKSLALVFRKADPKDERIAIPQATTTSSKVEKKGFWNTVAFWRSDRSKKGKGSGSLRIVIDPGHGGKEEGAIGPHGIMEKQITLEVAQKLKETLERETGAKVWLTRAKDKNVSLKKRNKVAQKKKADLFISIHANASQNKRYSGIETYYLNNATDEAAIRLAARENDSWTGPTSDIDSILSAMLQNAVTEDSRDLATSVQRSMVKQMRKSYKGVRDRGVRSALFYVLVGTKSPGILVETSFISNPREEMRLADPTYQQQLASSITDGIKKYLSKNGAKYSTL